MALNDGQIPKLANVINSGFAVLSATTGALGTNIGGQTVYTPGAFGGRVYSLLVSTSGVTTPTIYVYILKNGVTVMPVGVVNLTTGSGAGATKNVDALNNVQINGLPIDNTGKLYLPLNANEILRVSFQTVAAPTVFVTAFGLDYQN